MRHITPVSPSTAWMSGRELTVEERKAFVRANRRLVFVLSVIVCGTLATLFLLVQQVQKERPLTRVQYHATGALKLKARYLAGATHGLWERWYEDGRLMETGHFFNGRPDGCWSHYYRRGQVAKRACYDKGLYEGYVVSYRTNGTVRRSRFYQKGKVTPVTPFYYPLLSDARLVRHPR